MGLGPGLSAGFQTCLVPMPAVEHLALVQHDRKMLTIAADVLNQVGELLIGEGPEQFGEWVRLQFWTK